MKLANNFSFCLCLQIVAIFLVTKTFAGAVESETRTLDEIYAAALAEGGQLTVYTGGHGDHPEFAQRVSDFELKFPGIKINMVLDISQAIANQIDSELASNTLQADVVHILPLLEHFQRWKDANVLSPYKAHGWDHIIPEVKDSNSTFTGVHYIGLGISVNTKVLPNKADWPKSAVDLLKPEFDGKIMSDVPWNNAKLLFFYKLLVDKYGWDFMKQLATRIKCIESPDNIMRDQSEEAVILLGKDPHNVPRSQIVLLTDIDEQFVSWVPTVAIFEHSLRKETAKLYLNYLLDRPTVSGDPFLFTVRDNVPAPAKHIWKLPNTSSIRLNEFLAKDEALSQFKNEFRQKIKFNNSNR